MESAKKDFDNLLSAFYKNGGTIEDFKVEVHGELNEFTSRGCKGYIAYGNREILFFHDDYEMPFLAYVDNYGDQDVITFDTIENL